MGNSWSLRRSVASVAIAAAVGGSLIGGLAGVSAQDATPGAGGRPPLPENCGVYASGLLNPRYLAVARDGSVYVTEAGNAGDEKIYAAVGDGTPAPAEVLTTRGTSGQVAKIALDGTVTVTTPGLESYSFGTEVVGPAGIAISNGNIYVAVGGPGPAVPAIANPAGENKVYEIDPATGAATEIADIGAYEKANNPDPNAIDSDLYGIAAGPNGTLYVADAGGNTVYTIDPATKELKLLAVLPGLPSPGGKANPTRGGKAEIDPVPTDVIADPAGGVWVGLLTGGPFPPGAAEVVHVADDGAVTTAVSGLTMVTGLAAASDGTLYVSELSTNFLSQPPALGDVVRVKADGSKEVAISGLVTPNDIEFDAAGDLYVISNTTSAVGAPAAGSVLKCTNVANDLAAPAASPAATPASGATPAPATAVAAATASVNMVDIAFDPKALTIPANTDVAITATNTGVAIHTFNIEGTNFATGDVGPGDASTLIVNLPAGTYTYFCAIPGHREAGMVGVLTVQ